MSAEPGEITRLLHQWRQGDHDAEDRLFKLVWPDLRRLAASYLRKEGKQTLLQPTAVVNELYLRLHGAEVDWQDRAHFFALSARAMRRYLIDVSRRDEPPTVSLDLVPEPLGQRPKPGNLASEIGSLMEDLDKHDHDLCVAAELKCFLGLTDEEAAEVLGCSRRTFQRRWNEARKWLFVALEGEPCNTRTATTST